MDGMGGCERRKKNGQDVEVRMETFTSLKQVPPSLGLRTLLQKAFLGSRYCTRSNHIRGPRWLVNLTVMPLRPFVKVMMSVYVRKGAT